MSFVSLEKAGRVGIISLNRPEALNAISGALARDLRGVCDLVAGDESVWVVVLRAEGEKAFCVGADLKERASFSLDDYYENREQMVAMFRALRALPQPSVAAVFGFALGGGFELALSCDLIVAAEQTKMGLPEARVGLLPAGGGTQLLARRVGLARAKEIILTARRLDAGEAHEVGIAARVVAREELDDAAIELAREIGRASPVATRAAKRALDAALGTPLDQGMDLENAAWREVIVSNDRAEGIAAFNEKRDPNWSNS